MKVLGFFNAYFLILMGINGFIAIFVDSRQYKEAKKYGFILIIAAIVLYAIGKWYSRKFQ